MRNPPTLRVARASDDIAAILPFYMDGLGFKILAHFEDHQGFDGVILGQEGWPYHLEITHAHGHSAGTAPNQEALLVFYLPERDEWQRAIERMRNAGFSPVPSFNPYWDRLGTTFEDVDGYRIVFQQADW